MAQLFNRSANALAKVTLIVGFLAAAGGAWASYEFYHSPYMTRVDLVREQPVMFSHKHHVEGLGIDCRYCHTSVEVSSSAGIPSTHTCMSCHSQVWVDAPILEPVRASYRENLPLEWIRVNDLPDFVYFDHSIHVGKGIGCTTCHGPIDQMPLVRQVHNLSMKWCLDCHRNPEAFVRPREEVFNVNWQPPADQLEMGGRLVQEYGIETKTYCSACHR
ncbi:MAG TPA: cytochrome c3 family protein [Acidobacteriota bacterium]|nr:cytochrome c3 family protein [Acidobacteriota bacterium]